MWPLVILAEAVAPGFAVLVFERQCAITHELASINRVGKGFTPRRLSLLCPHRDREKCG